MCTVTSRRPRNPRAPQARPDLIFGRSGPDLVLSDATGAPQQVLDLRSALVWTYCDGRHSATAITEALAGELHEPRATPALEEDVLRTIHRFASAGLLR